MMTSDWKVKAMVELGEVSEEFVQSSLKKLRDIIKQNGDTNISYETEDEFLIRFLRVNKYDICKAMKGINKYYKARLMAPTKIMPRGYGPKDTHHLQKLCQYAAIRGQNLPQDGSTTLSTY